MCQAEISLSNSGIPSRIRFPFCGFNNESKILAAVDLPLPEGPTKATRDPTGISKVIPLRTELSDDG